MSEGKKATGLYLNRVILANELNALGDPGHAPKIIEVNSGLTNVNTFLNQEEIGFSVYYKNDGTVTLLSTKGLPQVSAFPKLIEASIFSDGKSVNSSIPHFDESLLLSMRDQIPNLYPGSKFENMLDE